MSKGDIRVSPQHGLNPSIGACFWCGKDTGEVIVVGRLPGDTKAPRRMVVSYTPCNSCKEQMDANIVMVEVVDSPIAYDQPPLQVDPKSGRAVYPTGHWLLTDDVFVKALMPPGFELDECLRVRKTFIEKKAWDMLGFPRAQVGGKNES